MNTRPRDSILTEDQVVEGVCRALARDGYEIEARALATQHGDDIVASKGGQRLIVEAKGAGSSKASSSRYGLPFTRNQVADHVAKAVLRAMRVVSEGDREAGVALPDDAVHRREVSFVAPALRRLGVGVFWVGNDGSVRIER